MCTCMCGASETQDRSGFSHGSPLGRRDEINVHEKPSSHPDYLNTCMQIPCIHVHYTEMTTPDTAHASDQSSPNETPLDPNHRTLLETSYPNYTIPNNSWYMRAPGQSQPSQFRTMHTPPLGSTGHLVQTQRARYLITVNTTWQ